MAVEALMNELGPDDADDALRRSIRAGCGKAVAAVEQLRDALDGLEHVGFGTSPPGTRACLRVEEHVRRLVP